MKRTLFTVATGALFLFSCQDAPEADKAEATAAQEVVAADGNDYKVDIAQSKVEWVGTKPTGRHHGTVKIKDGKVVAADSQLTGGMLTLDMNSIEPDDQDAEGNTKLGTHLRSEDFFQVEKHPEATFEITEVKAGVDKDNKDLVMTDATHTITGNLKIKEASKSITVPARVSMADGMITVDSEFNIDRTQWGINYRSDKSLGDKLIDPIVNIKIHVVANK